MKRMFGMMAAAVLVTSLGQAQVRDSTAKIATFQPTTFSPTWPFDYVPMRATGTTSGLPYLFLSNTFQFDTTTSTAKSINFLVNNSGTTLGADPCFIEQASTVVNKGVTNANCHVVYIPALSGTFGSNNALQVNATASHVRNASGQAVGKLNATGGLETCRVITAQSACWGTTLVAEDTAGAVGALVGVEIDVNLQNPIANYTGGAANPAGARAVFVSSNAGAIGVGFTAQKLTGSAGRWSVGFQTADSGASIGLSLGSVGNSASQAGQPLVFTYRDAGNVSRSGQFNLDASGNMNYTSAAGSATQHIFSNPVILSGGRMQDGAFALTCGAGTTPAIDASQGNSFTCNITSNVAVVLAVPSNTPATSARSQLIRIAFRNSSGGVLGTAPTFNTGANGFKFTGTCNPANGTQCVWLFSFDQLQGFWYQVGGTPTGL